MKLLRGIAAVGGYIYETLGRWGDESVVVKPDTAPRRGVNCRCSKCGVTQMVGGVEGFGLEDTRRVRRSRSCVGCGSLVSASVDAVDTWERW